MGLNRDVLRFDKRLIRRNLREGTISLEELNTFLNGLEDVSHLAAPPEEASEPEVEEEEEDDEEES